VTGCLQISLINRRSLIGWQTRSQFSHSLSDSLKDSLNDSLSDSLNNSLSLNDSLKDSLNDSLSDSLNDSLIKPQQNNLEITTTPNGSFVLLQKCSHIRNYLFTKHHEQPEIYEEK
uniref:Uncharacterized protein n=1 Tax=Amphiprion percula TaxID=161767 RepID=A0A3P8U8W4_AMPPE